MDGDDDLSVVLLREHADEPGELRDMHFVHGLNGVIEYQAGHDGLHGEVECKEQRDCRGVEDCRPTASSGEEPLAAPVRCVVSNLMSSAVLVAVGMPNRGMNPSVGASLVKTLFHTSLRDSVKTRWTMVVRACVAAACTYLRD